MTNRNGLRRCAFLAAFLLMLAAAGQAVAGGCTVSSSGLTFGGYQPLTFAGKRTSVDATSNASVSVICTGIVSGGSYSIALGPSIAGNSMSPRYLANAGGGANMAFNVYREASYSTVWGDGTSGSVVAGSIPAGSSNQSHTVYGKIPAGQSTLKVGSYSGSMTMTLTYNP